MVKSQQHVPVIRGMFINSHVKLIQEKFGEKGVKKLQEKYGKPVWFRPTEFVPVREEVQLLECALDLLYPELTSPDERSFEAGRLHFQNFTRTSYGKILFSVIPQDADHFRKIILNSKYVAQHVFRNVTFEAEDLGRKSAKVIMHNNDYPLEHFAGLFHEWMHFFGLKGKVESKKLSPTVFEYLMTWQ